MVLNGLMVLNGFFPPHPLTSLISFILNLLKKLIYPPIYKTNYKLYYYYISILYYTIVYITIDINTILLKYYYYL